MIDFYTFSTGNAKRAAIMLEESGLDFTSHRVALREGEHQQQPFLDLNPRGQVPAMVDRDGPGGEPLVLSQSVAIMLYVAEKSGRLLPAAAETRSRAMEWLMLVAMDVMGPFLQGFYLGTLAKVKVPDAVQPLHDRMLGYFGHIDRRLEESRYLAGDEYSIADVAAYPPATMLKEEEREPFANIRRWMEEVGTRDAVKRGMATGA